MDTIKSKKTIATLAIAAILIAGLVPSSGGATEALGIPPDDMLEAPNPTIGLNEDSRELSTPALSTAAEQSNDGPLDELIGSNAPVQMWATAHEAPANAAWGGMHMAVSPDGETVYAAASTENADTYLDYVVVAYDATTGLQLWEAVYNGPASTYDQVRGLTVSPDGFMVFVTGYSWGDSTHLDYATVAFDAATGAELWVARHNGPTSGQDNAFGLDVSPDSSKVFVTGWSSSVGTFSNMDIATVAYDAESGTFLWEARYDGPAGGHDSGQSMSVSPDSETVFVTGISPGVGTRDDYVTVAYDAETGGETWVARYDGPASGGGDQAWASAVSPDGDKVFATGSSIGDGSGADYATVAYDTATGNEAWVARYDGPVSLGDLGLSVEVSPGSERVFVTGASTGAGTDYDYATLAYDAATGTQEWVMRKEGHLPVGDWAFDLALSPDGDTVFVTGESWMDARGMDYVTVAYDAAMGEENWVASYNGAAALPDSARAIAVDPAGERVYVMGGASNTQTETEMTTVAYLLTEILDTGVLPIDPPSTNNAKADALSMLYEKADPVLADRLAAGDTTGFTVILTGPPHKGFTEDDFPDRKHAMRALDAHAQPFFDRVARVADVHGGEVTGTYSAAPAVALTDGLDALTMLAALPEVRHIALDYVGAVRLEQEVGVDPVPAEGGDEVGVTNTDGRVMIGAEAAWAAGFRGEGIKIAVIDSGVDATHEAFKFANGTSRIAAWANCATTTNECDTTGEAFDNGGHGTHVAGTAVGSSTYVDPAWGAYQETGVAPGATLFAVKFLGGAGGGSFEAAIKAVQWSFDNGADITSNSWAAGCSSSESLLQLVNQLTALGMVSVFAAGNSGPNNATIGGPACADAAISVGAVDTDYQIADFSSRGPCSDPTTETGQRICPDVVAKGVDVRSAVPRGNCLLCHSSGYLPISGTSMAAPHVAGALALTEQMKRHYTGEGWDTPKGTEKEVLKESALPVLLDGESPNDVYGWGHPQITQILGQLDPEPSDEAIIVDEFFVSNPIIRQGKATRLSFSVHNIGSAVATGDFIADLEHPDGTQQTLAETTMDLGLYEGSGTTHLLPSDTLVPGNYTFRGTFDYSWTNAAGDEVTGAVSHEERFSVVWTEIEIRNLEGFDDETILGSPQLLRFTAESVGNEAASNVTVRFSVPGSYQFVPSTHADNLDPNGLYADPAPDEVDHPPLAPASGSVELTWHKDTLSDEFTFNASILPTLPGRYQLYGIIDYEDGAGQEYRETRLFRQVVESPIA